MAGMLFQKRDLEILKALFACGFLSTSQLQKLFFGQNRSVVCRRLNKHLLPREIVARFRPGRAYDSTEAIYALGPGGVDILAEALDVAPSEIFRPNRDKYNPLFLNHTLEINDVWIALRSACSQSGGEFKLASWWTEKKLRKRYQRPGSEERPLPDSRFIVHQTSSQKEKLFLLELDRGTERIPVFQTKIERYLAYYLSQKHEADYGFKVFRVLTVVPDKIRLKTLLKASAEAGANNIFLFSTKDQVTTDQILSPIWITPRDFYDVSKDSSGTIVAKEKENGTTQKQYSLF